MSEPVILEQDRELDIVREPSSGQPDNTVSGNGSEFSSSEPLFPQGEASGLRKRWEQVQTEFVDDPRASVKKADQLVADAIQRLSETFTEQRSRMEHEWDKGEDVSTEQLRQALRKYRSFFDRLLTAGG